jgi:ElaA protein
MPTAQQLSWQFKSFEALALSELYELLRLRSEVFVVEQTCVFQDVDGFDPQAMHLLGHQGARLVAYARCFNAGIKFKEASIGRIITHASARGTGSGHALVRESISAIQQKWGVQPIRIGAQVRLEKFYQQHGFAIASAPYIEDVIPHIEMLRA